METTSSLSRGSFLYKISKFTLADKRDILLVQEPLKRSLHRWARLIRRQPGLEGLETQHEKKMTEISKSEISPSLSFSHISYANHQGEVRSSGDPPAIDWCSSPCLFLYGNVYLRVLFGYLSWLRLIRISPCL